VAEYDAKVIYDFAGRLYSKAGTIMAIYAMAGALLGFFLGYAARGGGSAVLGAVVLGGIGFYLGNEKAFQLKLQAQTALCQVKIEENTRGRVPA
jgi:uncharacterized membrane protein YfcA